MKSALSWFEIPTKNIERAAAFYEKVLATTLKHEDFFGTRMAVFPATDPGVGGALVQDAKRQPARGGTVVYLDATGMLDAAIERVQAAGGEILLPKTSIGPMGAIALLADTEGNVVGLHSP